MLAHHAEGLDHPHRVLEGVEAGDLEHYGPVPFHPQTVQDLVNLLRGELPVLFAQGIDGGPDQYWGWGRFWANWAMEKTEAS